MTIARAGGDYPPWHGAAKISQSLGSPLPKGSTAVAVSMNIRSVIVT
jgi:hypothetical protein